MANRLLQGLRKRSPRATLALLAAAATFAVAAPASAHWDRGGYHGHGPRHHHHGGYHRPAPRYYAPPPRYYAPRHYAPRARYYPAPSYYAPAPGYYASPGVSFGISIPIR